MKRFLNVGFVTLIRPTPEDVDAIVGPGERVEPFLAPRYGEIMEIRGYRITVRVFAPELKPHARRSWEKVTFFTLKPDHCQPVRDNEKIREVKRQFARLDRDCRRDNSKGRYR